MSVLEKDPQEELQKQAQKENLEAEAKRLAEEKSNAGPPPDVLVQIKPEPMETQVIQTVTSVSHDQMAQEKARYETEQRRKLEQALKEAEEREERARRVAKEKAQAEERARIEAEQAEKAKREAKVRGSV